MAGDGDEGYSERPGQDDLCVLCVDALAQLLVMGSDSFGHVSV